MKYQRTDLYSIITKIKPQMKGNINTESHLVHDLDLSSFDMIDLINEIYGKYGFCSDLNELKEIKTIRDVENLILANL